MNMNDLTAEEREVISEAINDGEETGTVARDNTIINWSLELEEFEAK